MTIDEAIKLHKAEATILTNGDNHKIAKWLEELKELRTVSMTSFVKGRILGRTEAIDDFREILLDKIANNYDYPNKHFKEAIYGVVNDAIVDVAEQLKGEKNGKIT